MFLNLLLGETNIPSVNHYWVTSGRRRFISKLGVEFKELMQDTAINAGFTPLLCDVQVHIIWSCAKKGRGDVDNKLKVILDSLIGIAYTDDSQVERILIERKKGTGCNELSVSVVKYEKC